MRKEDVIKNSIFYNSEVQRILKEFSKLQMEWLIKEIKREPYELMKEIKNENNR